MVGGAPTQGLDVSNGVIDKDLGWSRILANLIELDDLAVTVGIHAAEGEEEDESGTTIAEYAAYNEFGTEHIPERPWMRSNADENEAKYNGLIDGAIDKVLQGASPRAALAAVGVEVRNDLIDSIHDEDKYEPLADSTIARKRSSKPLRDTGAMQRAITVSVRPYASVGDE